MNKKLTSFTTLLLITCIFTLLFTGCLPLKPGAIRAKGRIYEQFTIPDNHNMYFFKFAEFKGNGNRVVMDATFNDKNIGADSVTLNFSYYTTGITKKLDSLSITSKTIVARSHSVQYIYTERKKHKYMSRFSCKMKITDYFALFNNNSWALGVFETSHTDLLISTKKTNKYNRKLKTDVVEIVTK